MASANNLITNPDIYTGVANYLTNETKFEGGLTDEGTEKTSLSPTYAPIGDNIPGIEWAMKDKGIRYTSGAGGKGAGVMYLFPNPFPSPYPWKGDDPVPQYPHYTITSNSNPHYTPAKGTKAIDFYNDNFDQSLKKWLKERGEEGKEVRNERNDYKHSNNENLSKYDFGPDNFSSDNLPHKGRSASSLSVSDSAAKKKKSKSAVNSSENTRDFEDNENTEDDEIPGQNDNNEFLSGNKNPPSKNRKGKNEKARNEDEDGAPPPSGVNTSKKAGGGKRKKSKIVRKKNKSKTIRKKSKSKRTKNKKKH